jgi:hypothetical protein
MNDILINMGLSDRFIRTLDNNEKNFFISINYFYKDLIENIKDLYPNIKEGDILIAIRNISKVDSIDDIIFDFEKRIYEIIKIEKRNQKLNNLLSESKVFKFVEFKNMTTFLP